MDTETGTPLPNTLQEAVVFFSKPENCHRFMFALRWPDGKVTCPRCGSLKVKYLPNARVFKCFEKHERQKFSLKVGTIFEDSAIPLEKWLPGMWLIVNCKNGISSYEIARATGVTQKTAWFMLQRARLAMQAIRTGGKLGGRDKEVEVDETFIGGRSRNMHIDKRNEKIFGRSGSAGKTAVMGLLERHGEIRLKIVPNVRRHNLVPHVREHVASDTEIFTDALKSYEALGVDDARYVHRVIDHAEAYAKGNVHTNGLENFWSLLKRGIRGTYVSVEPFHLFRYLDEQAFRYNNRKDFNDADRFVMAMQQIVGRRLTYRELTGKTEQAEGVS
jgi:transposase-like protein